MKVTRKVSQLDSFVKGFEKRPWHVGIDVHKRSYAVAVRREDGQIYTWTSPADPAALLNTFERHGVVPSIIVQEAGPTGYQLSRTLARAGIDVRVAAAGFPGQSRRGPNPIVSTARSWHSMRHGI